MANYPRRQADIYALALSMIKGFTEHPDYFPDADAATLQTALDEFDEASKQLQLANARTKAAAVMKKEKLNNLQTVMKGQLKLSQVDCTGEPVRLGFIGWGPVAEPSDMPVPKQPGVLEITAQGVGGEGENRTGIIGLRWRKPVGTSRRAISYYAIERRQMQPKPADLWQHAGSAIDDQVILKAEPLGVRLEYRVRAVNKAGESYPSNIVAVIL